MIATIQGGPTYDHVTEYWNPMSRNIMGTELAKSTCRAGRHPAWGYRSSVVSVSVRYDSETPRTRHHQASTLTPDTMSSVR